jgi:cytochrome c biogenesis protein CcmG, thiol:disulfide interchange protein DsbE
VLYQLSYHRAGSLILRPPTRSRRGALRPRGLAALYPSLAVRRLLGPTLATLLGVALLGLLLYGVTHQAPSRTLDQAIADGQQPLAPEATQALPALIGGGSWPISDRSLAAYRGRVVVLNFWASWCPGCQAEAPEVERLQRGLARHGATVLGVTYEDIASDSLAFVRRYHLTFPNLVDGSGEFGRSAYGTDQLPESFLINRSGHVTAISRGEVEKPFVERALRLAESA